MKHILLFSLAILLWASCYTFKGVSISPDVNTFYVGNFEIKGDNVPVSTDIEFSEALRTKIRSESRLKMTNTNPDVTFEGAIMSYTVTAESPQEGNTVALNKIEIIVQVSYTNTKNEKENYSRNFSFFRTFPGDQDLQSVQAALNKDIYNQLTERIFNETFATW